jgi:hypothetical protein
VRASLHSKWTAFVRFKTRATRGPGGPRGPWVLVHDLRRVYSGTRRVLVRSQVS